MEITRERMEEAVMYLAETDVPYARAKALADGLAEQRKTVKANCFMRAGGNSAAQKEQTAYSSMEYKQHLEKMHQANQDYLILQAKRKTEEIVIDCWRSLNSARNRQQIV